MSNLERRVFERATHLCGALLVLRHSLTWLEDVALVLRHEADEMDGADSPCVEQAQALRRSVHEVSMALDSALKAARSIQGEAQK